MAKGARYHSMAELMELFPNNPRILEAVLKTEDHINTQARDGGKIMVSISGGSDSDIMLDMFERLGYDDGEVVYVWIDTGLEYDATKRHLKYLEEKYGINIKRYRPAMTVAQACKRYGVPFLSKQDSNSIYRLQSKGFDFKSEDFDDLVERFPRTMTGIKYWLSLWDSKDGKKGKFSQGRHAGLHEFMLANDPPKISDQCCKYAKKRTSITAEKEIGATLKVTGVRRAENGVRSVAYTSCFSAGGNGRLPTFMPLFYLTDADKEQYKAFAGLFYSACYEVWGFKRTGCVCCPFGSKFEAELKVVQQWEPKLHKTALKIFGESYDYTRRYRVFRDEFKKQKRLAKKKENHPTEPESLPNG